METPNVWRVACQDPGDGSGDIIIDLPPELLSELGWTSGDELIAEKDEVKISLSFIERQT